MMAFLYGVVSTREPRIHGSTRVASLLLAAMPLMAQAPVNFVQKVFGTGGDQPMLGREAPEFTLSLASREFSVERTGDTARLTIPDIPVRFEMRHERQSGIDLYRLRHAKDSEPRGEQIRSGWSFPAGFNDSMTLDTGALQGQPLYLPDGKVPDNQFTNWGSLFYHREANLVVGTKLSGAEASRHARRGHSRFTGITTLQLVTTSGNPNLEIVFFAYRPKDSRFWWAEWLQLRGTGDPDIPVNFFPILSARDISWEPGDSQIVSVVPGPRDAGRQMEMVVVDEIRQALVSRVPFPYELPVTNVSVRAGDWPSGLYRLIVVPKGASVDPAAIDLNGKLTNVIVRPKRPRGQVLFIAPTDMWWAYSTNGGHDYHGWRTAYDGSVGYSPTVMSSRHRRLNHFYYSLYERYNDIHHFRHLNELSKTEGYSVDFATQHDVALGRVRLDDYRLVLIGNHCEFTTKESHQRFKDYLGRGGAVVIHGGDSFAVLVEYLPSLSEPRYIWQRGHIRTHLSDAPSDFRSPSLLEQGASPDAPILNASAGDALDYLNVFHTTVGYWIPGSRAVIANADHPVVSGLNLKPGDEVPGPWGGEVDFLYEPQAWNVLVRSDRAEPESREFGIDAFDPTPLHRVGLAVHNNLRLAVVCGENFPNILLSPANSRFRELYRRTLRYLLDAGKDLEGRSLMPAQGDGSLFELEQAEPVGAVRYELPEFIDFAEPEWHKKATAYAHYVVEGSADGRRWFTLADRRHGPWRGMQTDLLSGTPVRYIRFDGTLSNGKPFRVRNLQVIASKARDKP